MAFPEQDSSASPNQAVLVVDDEPAIRDLLQKGLLAYGLEVITAASAADAVAVCASQGERIGALLLDVLLPGQDGPHILDMLRKQLPNVPCCFMSGSTGRYTEAQLLSLGAAHVFYKPFSLETVAFALRRLLGLAERRKGGRNYTAPQAVRVGGHTAFIRNRCADGVGLWLSQSVQVGAILRLQAAPMGDPATETHVEIRHCRPDAAGWYAGCRFTASV
jgi:DNA-binding response OmpR family regulator